jgi:hypothetical protein
MQRRCTYILSDQPAPRSPVISADCSCRRGSSQQTSSAYAAVAHICAGTAWAHPAHICRGRGGGGAPASRARPWRPPRGPAGLSPPRRRRRGPSQSCSATAVRRCSAAARRQRLRSVGARRERRVRDGLRKRRKLRGLAELGLPHALKADCTPQRGAQPSTSWRERAQPAASAQPPRHCHTPSRAGARRCVMDGACACVCGGGGGGAALTSSHSDSAVMDSVARSSALKASRCTDRLHARAAPRVDGAQSSAPCAVPQRTVATSRGIAAASHDGTAAASHDGTALLRLARRRAPPWPCARACV